MDQSDANSIAIKAMMGSPNTPISIILPPQSQHPTALQPTQTPPQQPLPLSNNLNNNNNVNNNISNTSVKNNSLPINTHTLPILNSTDTNNGTKSNDQIRDQNINFAANIKTPTEKIKITGDKIKTVIQHTAFRIIIIFVISCIILLSINPPFVQCKRKKDKNPAEASPCSYGKVIIVSFIIASLGFLIPLMIKHSKSITDNLNNIKSWGSKFVTKPT